jgi:Na+:H+ antiporter
VLTWGGMRGSLSMVLALGLPPALAHRNLLITVTFGVVLLSILLQGMTMLPLLQRLGVVRGRDARMKYEIQRGALRMTQAALDEIAKMQRQQVASPMVLGEVRSEYETRSVEAAARVEALQLEQHELRAEESVRVHRQALLAEKEALLAELHLGALSTEAHGALLADVDARLASLLEGSKLSGDVQESRAPGARNTRKGPEA